MKTICTVLQPKHSKKRQICIDISPENESESIKLISFPRIELPKRSHGHPNQKQQRERERERALANNGPTDSIFLDSPFFSSTEALREF